MFPFFVGCKKIHYGLQGHSFLYSVYLLFLKTL
nr:MAG TPA: hypothetical protein [Caudoviricetes sp.]